MKSLSISGKSGGISTVFAKLALLFCSIFLFLLSDTIKNLQIIIVAIHTYDVDITSRIRIFRRLSKINQNKADLPYLQHLVVARTVGSFRRRRAPHRRQAGSFVDRLTNECGRQREDYFLTNTTSSRHEQQEINDREQCRHSIR